jgi:hypothetical protein
MKAIGHTLRGIVELFFDDGKLALAIVALLACTSVVAKVETPASWMSITLLVGGTLALLFENVLRAGRGR